MWVHVTIVSIERVVSKSVLCRLLCNSSLVLSLAIDIDWNVIAQLFQLAVQILLR